MLVRICLPGLLCLAAVCLQAQTNADYSSHGFKPNPDIINRQQADSCYILTRAEADRAFRYRAWKEAENLYRAAKNCPDANQQNRKELQRQIVASQTNAKVELLEANKRLEEEQKKALRLARQSMATNIARIAADFIELQDRTTAFRLADFANTYIAPADEDNPACVQAMLDVWNYDPSASANKQDERPVYVPFGYELASDLGPGVMLKFVNQNNTKYLYVYAPAESTLYIWDMATFKLVTKKDKLHKVEWFDYLPKQQLLVLKDSLNLLMFKDGKAVNSLALGPTRSLTVDHETEMLYYYAPGMHAVLRIDLNEGTISSKKAQQTYKRVSFQPVVMFREMPMVSSIAVGQKQLWLFAEDSLFIAERNSTKNIDLWSITNKFFLNSKQINPYVEASQVYLRPSSRLLFTQIGNQVCTYRVDDQGLVLLSQEPGSLMDVNLSGNWSAIARFDTLTSQFNRIQVLQSGGLTFATYISESSIIGNNSALSTSNNFQKNTDEWLATTSYQGIVKVWHLETGTAPVTLLGKRAPNTFRAQVSNDGAIITGDANGFYLSNPQQSPGAIEAYSAELGSFDSGAKIQTHDNGSFILWSGGRPDSLLIFNGASNQLIYQPITYYGPYPVFAFDETGAKIAYSDDNGMVIVAALEANSVRQITSKNFNYTVTQLAFIPETDKLVVQCTEMGERISAFILPRIWQYTQTNNSVETVRLSNYPTSLVAVSPVDHRIAFSNGADIHIFEPENLIDEVLFMRKNGEKNINVMMYHPNNGMLAVGYDDGSIIFFSESGAKQFEITSLTGKGEDFYIEGMSFSEDGSTLTVLNRKGQMRTFLLDISSIRLAIQPAGRSLLAFTPEQISQYELDRAFDYDNNPESLANSNDAPLIRSFISFFGQQSRSTNNINLIRNNCKRAFDLYTHLNQTGKIAETENMLTMFDNYLFNLIQRKSFSEAETVLKMVENTWNSPVMTLKHRGHLALLNNNFITANKAYTNWIIATQDYFNQELSYELGQMYSFNMLSKEQQYLLCSLSEAQPVSYVSFDFCYDPDPDSLSQKLTAVQVSNAVRMDRETALRWQVFLDLEKAFSIDGNSVTNQQWIELFTKTRNTALELARINPSDGVKWVEKSTIALANAYKRNANFEDYSRFAPSLMRKGIQTLENAGKFKYYEIDRLDTLAAMYLELGNILQYKDPATAITEYKSGLEVFAKIADFYAQDNAQLAAQADRIASPLYTEMGKTYLLLDKPELALDAFENANDTKIGQLNSLYMGHVSVLQGKRDESFIEYGDINSEQLLGNSLADLKILADHIPAKKTSILNISAGLKTGFHTIKEEWDREWTAYYYHSALMDYYKKISQWDSAYYYSMLAYESLPEQEFANPKGEINMIKTDRKILALASASYFVLFKPSGSDQTAALQSMLATIDHWQAASKDEVLPYNEYLLMNAAHALALLNQPQKAKELYQKFLAVSYVSGVKGTPQEIIEKDFRDLRAAGVQFPFPPESLLK